ncbi:MAG: hypothetical protein WBC91_24135 [Phototrophicaceae bacterium]
MLRNRFFLIISIIIASIALVACDVTPEENTDAGITTDTDTMTSNASDTSDYQGVVLTLNEILNTEAGDGAAAGTLQLTITLENTTDATITLPFATEDYILSDPNGLNTVPTVISDDLVEVELASGASVTGDVEYAVEAPEASYIFSLGDFEDIAINPTAEN